MTVAERSRAFRRMTVAERSRAFRRMTVAERSRAFRRMTAYREACGWAAGFSKENSFPVLS